MARVRRASIPIVLALLAMPGQAWAQAQDAVQRAHIHFEAGRALYRLGNFTEAAREFTAGYELVPRPGFLLNLGQCYIAMHELDKAHDMYRRWLHDAAADDPKRPEAEQIVGEIERKLAEQASGPEGTRTGEIAPPPLDTATLHASAPAHKPWIKRNWWVIPVSLVIAGAAVGVGVYFGTRNDPCAGANVIGCYALSMKGSP